MFIGLSNNGATITLQEESGQRGASYETLLEETN
jgi:hypothetical protein